jgi:hypothetical protein
MFQLVLSDPLNRIHMRARTQGHFTLQSRRMIAILP